MGTAPILLAWGASATRNDYIEPEPVAWVSAAYRLSLLRSFWAWAFQRLIESRARLECFFTLVARAVAKPRIWRGTIGSFLILR